MSTVPQGMTTPSYLEKEMIFKKDESGKGKSGRPFRVVELHDPQSLENVPCFIQEGTFVDTTGIMFKDRVTASFGMDIVFGRPQMVLKSIKVKK